MNREEIDNIEAGDTLDSLIAEHVMGWHDLRWDKGGYEWLGWQNEWNKPISRSWPQGWYGKGPGHETYLTDKYSSDVASAWKVVERFHPTIEKTEGCNVQLDGHGEGYTFHIFADATCYEAEADTFPLAVCRAALKAVYKIAMDERDA